MLRVNNYSVSLSLEPKGGSSEPNEPLPSFMFVSAVVSEIFESKEKEKEKKNNYEIDYFQFNTFPGHII